MARRRQPRSGASLGRILLAAFLVLLVFSLLLRYGHRLGELGSLLPGRGEERAAAPAMERERNLGAGEKHVEAPAARAGAAGRDMPAEPRLLRLQILNATGLNDLALITGECLRVWQVDALDRGNAPSWPFPETMLIVRGERQGDVKRLARRLGGVPVIVQRREDLMLDATLILGHDWESYNWPEP